MRVKVNKPIMFAGLGLSFLLWLGDILHQEIIAVGEWGFLSLMALGTGVWWWQDKKNQKPQFKPVSALTLAEVNQSISNAQMMLNYITEESSKHDISDLKTQLQQLPTKFNNQALSLGLVGSNNRVKSSLKSLLENQDIITKINWVEPDLSQDVKINLDLVLFLINGDLTESQWQIIEQSNQNHQRCLIVLNKQEQYSSEEQELIRQQIQERVKSIIPPDDVIAINSTQTSLKVRQYQKDGSHQEWTETKPPNIKPLTERLCGILDQERKQLIWGKVWREAVEIKRQGKIILNQIRRDRALPMIEKYQWIAAAAAFANPVSSLDLLATAAINAQMVVDLTGIYQQKFTLSQGKAVSATIGKLMVKLGLVELSTHAISSLLKSNAITYVAGGVTQGISAAYLTRVAGLSLVEYFQEQEINSENYQGIDVEKLSTKMKQVFEQTKRTEVLQAFVKQTVPKLS
jgi:uncharacterized protein (DUF697 family)